MERMTGIDPMFIYSDTPETPMEIAYACIFDPATADGWLHLRSASPIASRRGSRRCPPSAAGSCPSRLVSITRAGWTTLSSTWTTTCTAPRCPAPGGEAEFTALVAEVMGRPLTPGQPPWEMHVIEGLAGGKVGLIAKVHHAVIDGVAGAQLLAQLLDLDARGRAVTEPCPPWLPARLPSQTQLMTDALPSFIKSPVRGAACRARSRPHRRPAGPLRGRRPPRPGVDALRCARHLRVARRRPAGGRLRRARAWPQVRALKERFGSTINDVVLAVCSGALRTHLAAHDQEAESPLVAVVPVSVRGDDGMARGSGNQLSAMFVPLANDCKTPLGATADRDRGSASCKGQERAVGYGPMATLPGRRRPAGTGQARGPARGAARGSAQAARRQPDDLQRARAGLPALLRRHAAPWRRTRSGRSSTAWR